MQEIFFLRFYYDFDTVGRYEFDRLSIWGYDFVTILLRFRYGSGYGLDTILIRFRYDFGTNLIWFWNFVEVSDGLAGFHKRKQNQPRDIFCGFLHCFCGFGIVVTQFWYGSGTLASAKGNRNSPGKCVFSWIFVVLIRFNTILIRFWYDFVAILLRFWYDFDTILLRFWYDFVTILLRFWYDFDTI